MFVLGTAGHVDHGKSTLIERITGIDPDRLAEEKARGLTIDLGFAWLTLPSGRDVGIVDVPGHERFVHNMLAGAASVDATIFVVAANEGWKPQSEEHLAILDLLGARGGVIALTKTDLVGGDERDAVAATVRSRVASTALDGAAIVPVSAVSGEGIDELLGAIDSMLDATDPAPDRERPRLFVDRSFSIKGAGTVVTGTLTGGRIRLEDEVEILPSGARGRVRSIQTHKQRRSEAEPGSRVALNIAGIDRHEITRGDAVVKPGQWRQTEVLDVSIRPVRGLDHPLTSRGAYKLHLGSAEVDARVRFLDSDSLDVGREALARLTLASPIVADAFDRFVVRDRGRGETVAGGTVLDPHPLRARLGGAERQRRVDQLRRRLSAGTDGIRDVTVEEREVVSGSDLGWLTGTTQTSGPLDGFAVSPAWFERTSRSLVGTLRGFHDTRPLERGMQREDARAAIGIDDQRLFAALVAATADHVAADGPLLRLASHRVTLSPEQLESRARVVGQLDAAGLAPPTLRDLGAAHGVALVTALVEAGDLVKFSSEFALTRERYEETLRSVGDSIRAEGALTTSRLREILGTSRKYAIPLLEHLDATGFTKRRGDVRELAD